jgi:hypothetical protein
MIQNLYAVNQHTGRYFHFDTCYDIKDIFLGYYLMLRNVLHEKKRINTCDGADPGAALSRVIFMSPELKMFLFKWLSSVYAMQLHFQF